MNDNTIKKLIVTVSVVIPVLVAIILFSPFKTGLDSGWISYLPTFHALVNSTTSIVLIGAVWAVSNGKIDLHKKLMSFAFILGGLFLLSYVLYHSSAESVKFGDKNGDGILTTLELEKVGVQRIIYLIVLLSHIALSIVVVPFVLFSFYYSLTDKIEKHKRIVKFTFPIWLYVSVTGVVVYLMISPYY